MAEGIDKWTPDQLAFIEHYIVQVIKHPQYYSETGFLPKHAFVSLFSRSGNRVAERLAHTLRSFRCTLVDASDAAKEEQVLQKMNKTLAAQKTPQVLIVDHAEALSAHEEFVLAKVRHAPYSGSGLVVLIFGVPPSRLPAAVRFHYIGQPGESLYVPPLSESNRAWFFVHIFTAFADHVAKFPELRLSVNMSPDDYILLAEYARQLTADEIQQWCERTFRRIAIPRAEPLVITLQYLKDTRALFCIIEGASYQLLEYDGNALETQFSMDAGQGSLPARDAAADQYNEEQQRKRARLNEEEEPQVITGIINAEGVEEELKPSGV